MDIQLPKVSGLEVTRWIKDDPELRAIPVVAVTAFAMKGDEERIRGGWLRSLSFKAISVGKFIETVRRFIGLGEKFRCPRVFWSSTTFPPTFKLLKRGCRRDSTC